MYIYMCIALFVSVDALMYLSDKIHFYVCNIVYLYMYVHTVHTVGRWDHDGYTNSTVPQDSK